MADILPFIGTRYNSQLIGNLGKVLAPPYDIITPEQQDELIKRHDNNVVRLILPKEESGDDAFSNKYTRAANTLKTWRSDGILIEENQPSIYLYEQEFKLPTGETKKRQGFFALVKLDDCRPAPPKNHDQSLSGTKSDQLKLIRSTHANLSPIFALYNDPDHKLTDSLGERMGEKAWEEAVDDDGVIHRLWVIHKKDFIMKVRELMKERQLFIADGHQRFEMALNFRDEMREETGKADGKQPFDYMMMYLTSADQDGLVILPTHRALSRSFMAEVDLQDAFEELRENFTMKEEKFDLSKPAEEAQRITDKLAELGQKGNAFAMLFANGKLFYMLLKKDVDPDELIDNDELHPVVKRLDVTILHHYIINQVFVGNPEFELDEEECFYVRDVKRVFSLLSSKKASLAFLLNATPLDQVMEIGSAGLRMPPKTTYFHPKIISGLVIRNMDCEMKKAPKR